MAHRQKLKPIHLGTCLGDLNKMVDTPITQKNNIQAKGLLQSAQTLFVQAKKSLDLGDEEQAYIYYMRTASLIMAMKKAKGYSDDTKYYDSLTDACVRECLMKSEALTGSLTVRYKLLNLASKDDAKLKAKEINDATAQEELKKKNLAKPHVNGVIKLEVKEEQQQEQNISVAQLKNLIEQKATHILVIDCRGKHDFMRSHVTHPNCISIPQEVLEPGMSANKIESKLKEKYPESYHLWNKRSTFDKVILYDWNTSWSENVQEKDNSLATLFTAMTKWDHETVYKSPPAILRGGCRGMYYSYPTLMTHPQNMISDMDLYEENGDGAVNGNLSKKEIKSLDSISYPTFPDDDEITSNNKPLNNIDTSRPASTPNQKLNNLSGPTINNKFSGNNNSIPVPPTSATIDRSTKPKSASATTTNVPNNNIHVPTQHRNGPNNGTVSSSIAEPKENGISSRSAATGDATEDQVAALNAALDNVIISSKDLKVKEQELEEIMNNSTRGEYNENSLREKLKLKEDEIERLQKVVKSQDANLNTVKAEYDALLARRSKPSLPQIRPTLTDSTIDSKFKEKAELEDYVREIRAKRKEVEYTRANTITDNTKLPPIPGSGPNSPRPLSRSRVGKSESTTTFPNLNKATISNGHGGSSDVKGTQSANTLLRPMSQDATPISFQKLRDEPTSESPRSLLKRSHSHPNIAQSLSEEEQAFNQDGGSATLHPQFNRNLKPSANSRPSDLIVQPSRARQFHAVNSTEKHRTGLKNLGNTCYMNSIVQCLVHLPGVVSYFMSELWKKHLEAWRPQKQKQLSNGEVSIEFHAVVQEMNYGHRSIAIMDFKNSVGRHNPTFRGYDQQDSHEFLTMLLDWLHEELNTAPKAKLNEQKNEGLSDKEAANKAWHDYTDSNCSRIVDLFCGQQKSALRCLSCGKESVTFEPFFNLSVPIPSINNRKVDIYQCIDLYTTEEVLSGWNCPHCKSTVKATKKIDLWRMPPYLIIHLQRFYNDGWWKKRLTEVDFPVDNLELTSRVKGSPLTPEGRTPRSNFMLQAVSNHYGSMDGGHYTAYCRKNSHWARFDDQEVSQLNSRDVTTPAAYILFYCNNSP